MENKLFTIRVPATTANLGPGFDVLGLALELWNDLEVFGVEGRGRLCRVAGFGAGILPEGDENLVLRAARHLFKRSGSQVLGLHFRAVNRIPLGSGMGSSSAAIVAGLMAANELLGGPFSLEALLQEGSVLEGHADNVAPALYGGLTACMSLKGGVMCRQLEAADWMVGVVVPGIERSTAGMRAALPARLGLPEAVFNLGRAVLVVEALRVGDLALLREAMADRLHQEVRLGRIPGGLAALEAARGSGVAAALSGAGPGLSLFAHSQSVLSAGLAAVAAVFEEAGLDTWSWSGKISSRGALIF